MSGCDARRRRARNRNVVTGWQRRRAAAAVRYATVSLVLAGHTDRDQRLITLLRDCLTAQRGTIAADPA